MHEFCPAETPHKGGLILRWSDNNRQFWHYAEHRWSDISEFTAGS